MSNVAAHLLDKMSENRVVRLHYLHHNIQLRSEGRDIIERLRLLVQLVRVRLKRKLSAKESSVVRECAVRSFRAHHQLLNDISNQLGLLRFNDMKESMKQHILKTYVLQGITIPANCKKEFAELRYKPHAVESALIYNGNFDYKKWKYFIYFFGQGWPMDINYRLLSLFKLPGVNPDFDEEQDMEPLHLRKLALKAEQAMESVPIPWKDRARLYYLEKTQKLFNATKVKILLKSQVSTPSKGKKRRRPADVAQAIEAFPALSSRYGKRVALSSKKST
jgi:hypothetical protein